jgi:hypothetical protein
MKKTLRRVGLLAAGLLVGAPIAQAQQTAKAPPTLAELEKNLQTISEGDEESVAELVDQTARQLVAYLKAHVLSDADQATLGLDETAVTQDITHLKAYTFGYSSGGTRGTVHVPVLQWQNAAGKLFAYRMHEECELTEMYKLASPGRTLYLLLGQEQGDMNTTASMAYVLELRGDYLRLDNAVFGQRASLIVGNVEMSFDKRKQVLRLDLSDHDASEEDDKLLAQLGYRGTFPKRPMTLFRRTYPPQQSKGPGKKVLDLKFTGERFVKSN